MDSLRQALARFARGFPLDIRMRRLLRVAATRAARTLGVRQRLPGLDPGAVKVAGPGAKVDLILFGVIDWHFRFQRPQQLATELARLGHRVFYLSTNFLDQVGQGFRVEPLDDAGRLYQVFLAARNRPSIYADAPSPPQIAQLQAGLEALIGWAGSQPNALILNHPFWWSIAAGRERSALLYDRMDYHRGFGGLPAAVIEEEETLMTRADLVVASSQWLERDTARFTSRHVLIRNGADYEHFARRPAKVYRDPCGRRVLGYYGAIAGWLDTDVLGAVADAFPDCSVVLIGHDQSRVAKRLSRHPNLVHLEEVPYGALPTYLHGFDVCLLPRRLTALTNAMNPVKLYEYLCTGIPVVSTNLPEVSEFEGLVYSPETTEAFVEAVATALTEPADDPRREQRRRFAAGQTWAARATKFEQAIRRALSTSTAHGERQGEDEGNQHGTPGDRVGRVRPSPPE